MELVGETEYIGVPREHGDPGNLVPAPWPFCSPPHPLDAGNPAPLALTHAGPAGFSGIWGD